MGKGTEKERRRRIVLAGFASLALLGLGAGLAFRGDAAPGGHGRALATPGTTLLVLRARARSVELVAAHAKPFPCPETAGGGLLYRVLDRDGGQVVAEGSVPAPELCRCGGAEHPPRGCVPIRHEAVVRVKVPRRVARERIRFTDARTGADLGAFDLEGQP